MRCYWLAGIAILLLAGCGGRPELVRVGPGVSVSTRLIDEYMREHGASREEAKAALIAEMSAPAAPSY